MAEKGGINKNNKKTLIIAVCCGLLFLAGLGAGLLIPVVKEKIKETGKEDFDVKKYIKTGDYKTLEVSLAVTQDDIDAEIDDLREQHTIYEKLDGKVADGDMIYADIVGYVDGKRAGDTCTRDYVTIGSGDWLDGFEDALIGAEAGKTTGFTIPVPMGTFGDKAIDGHDVQYKVKVEYICGDAIVPEYDDSFVQSISDYKNTEEYDKYLRKKLLKENESDKAEYAWSDFLDTCKVKKYPDDMMEAAEDIVLQGYYDMAGLYGYTNDEVFQSFGYESEEDFRKTDLDELAKDTVKENLAALALSEQENISYTEEDYQKIVDEEFSYNEDDYDSKEDYESKNRQELKNETLMKVVKDWLAGNVKFITE